VNRMQHREQVFNESEKTDKISENQGGTPAHNVVRHIRSKNFSYLGATAAEKSRTAGRG